nr:tobamovirus multiplication protein 1 isoform X1 [Arachis hypogaea]
MSELGGGNCFPRLLLGVNVGLALVEGIVAFVALFQVPLLFLSCFNSRRHCFSDMKLLLRIHLRNQELGWTRQKVFHVLIGSSNLGYFVYLVLALFAACNGWRCWSDSCGFIFMAFPKILFFAAFLLLLSFWVDLCHQPDDDDDYEGSFIEEALLEKTSHANLANIDSHRKCFPVRLSRIGYRQKLVILVTLLLFIIMMAFAVIIWIGLGENPIDSEVASRIMQVYLDLSAIAMVLLGAALACYGILLYLKMRKVRAEQPSSEMWKVAGLTIVSVLCFVSSSCVELLTDIPLLYHWHQWPLNDIYASLLLVLYYFVGSSLPSAVVLWVMRELPPAEASNVQEESRTLTFVADSSVATHNPQRWTTTTSMQNQASRASPI